MGFVSIIARISASECSHSTCSIHVFFSLVLQVRGQAIAAVSIISSAESFLVPHRAVERRLLELCLQGAVEDIRVSGQTGEAETQNALMVMRLVEDFIFTPGILFHDDGTESSCFL